MVDNAVELRWKTSTTIRTVAHVIPVTSLTAPAGTVIIPFQPSAKAFKRYFWSIELPPAWR
ncbi:MAG: hypothetical protein AABZ62_06435 [Planctomycetota bacterium]|jgi:hypothetical protein